MHSLYDLSMRKLVSNPEQLDMRRLPKEVIDDIFKLIRVPEAFFRPVIPEYKELDSLALQCYGVTSPNLYKNKSFVTDLIIDRMSGYPMPQMKGLLIGLMYNYPVSYRHYRVIAFGKILVNPTWKKLSDIAASQLKEICHYQYNSNMEFKDACILEIDVGLKFAYSLTAADNGKYGFV